MKYFIILAMVCATIGFSEVKLNAFVMRIILFLINFLFWSQQAISKEQAMEMFKGLINQCSGKEGASPADAEEALAKKFPSTQQGKCLHACIGETLGVVGLLSLNLIE